MKSLLGVVLVGVIIFGYAEVWGADWVEYAYQELKGEKTAIHLYDSEDLMVDKHLIKVWVKSNITEAWIEKTKKENPGSTITFDNKPRLLEINCMTKMYRILQGSYFDRTKQTDVDVEDPSKWWYFSPDSTYRFLYERLCLGK